MNEKISSLKEDLELLKKKYNFDIFESENYDGKENYSGSEYYFSIDGEIYLKESIIEILQKK